MKRRFDKLKPDALAFRDAVAKGVDPFTVPLSRHNSDFSTGNNTGLKFRLPVLIYSTMHYPFVLHHISQLMSY